MKNTKKEIGLGALLLAVVSAVCIKGMKAIDKKMKKDAEQEKKN